MKRLTDSIAQGETSRSIMNAISEREEELRSITVKLLEPAPGSVSAKLEELREFAVKRLAIIREPLAHPEDIEKAHAAWHASRKKRPNITEEEGESLRDVVAVMVA